MKTEPPSSGAKDAEWEVLPPESKDSKPIEPLFRWIALLMDNLIRVPVRSFASASIRCSA